MKSLISIDCKNRKLFFVDEIKFKVEKLLKQNNLILKFQKWNVILQRPEYIACSDSICNRASI